MGSCRCKMCGGHIHYDNNASVATCEFCGTEQTIVKTDDTKKVNLFNRANALRMQNEFDKAQLTYDNILIDEPNNAEAHWGICLCRYGVEYVTVDGKKVPTCHRTSIRNIFEDLDYIETINNADVVAKEVYEKEAKALAKIQKEILSISQKEEPYDIFISYKEHDENNGRTKDSIKGEEIYKELEKKGYRVFYSRITLKNTETTKYEPIIFAALMSSKVMLSLGSKKEHFTAIWEKNEWSRFMSLMKEDHKKYLIPCYFDMDSKDLPEDFMMLESQNVSDNNLEPLIKRIDKLFAASEKVVVSSEQVEVREKVVNKLSVENTIGRIGLFLADGKFGNVNELVEKVLNTDYTCALAYYYKMLSSYGCKNEEELISRRIVLDNDKNCEKALKFADNELKSKIEDINEKVKEAILEKEKNDLIKKIDSNIKSGRFNDAINELKDLYKYKNTEADINRIREEIYQAAVKRESEKKHSDAIYIFTLLGDYRDSKAQIEEIKNVIRVEDECKKCNELAKSIEATIKHINGTNVFDEKTLKNLNKKIEEIRDLTLSPTSSDRYYQYKEEYKKIIEKRDKNRHVNKIVVLVMLGITVVIAIAALICACIFVKK